MVEESISSSHIEKLGHKILEIRERALFNIVSKLENGILFDNDLARNKELLKKLFHWFLFEPCTQEQVVFTLLKHILKSESGRILINHYGKSALKHEICQMRSYLEPKYYTELDEVYKLVDDKAEEYVILPIETDIPLSYRTNTERLSNFSAFLSPTVGTTATVIEGYIQKESFAEEQIGVQHLSPKLSFKDIHDDNGSTTSRATKKKNQITSDFYLKWQPLVESDRHVLHSVENSLKNPPEPSALLSSCEFFTNILLHDFPAEIFLQRPTIVLEFYNLVTCQSTRISNAVLNALCGLTKSLQIRIHHCTDTSLRNLKNDLLCQSRFVCNSPRFSEKNSEHSDVFDNMERIEDILVIEKSQLSFNKYCFMTLSRVFEYLRMKQDEFGDNKLKLNKTGINFCLILLEEIFHLLCVCFEKDIWDSEQTEKSLAVLRGFNVMLIQYGETLEYFRVAFMVSETQPAYRIIYLFLIHNTAMLLRSLVPFSKAGTVLPRTLKYALSNSLLDVPLGKLYPEVHGIILDYVKSFSVVDEVEPIKKYECVSKVCDSMSAAILFLKQHKYLGTSECFKAAKDALSSIEFHTNSDFLKIFVDVCSSKFYQISDNYESTKVVEEVVLELLSHNLMEIKKEMYRLCHRAIITHIGPEARIDSTGLHILFLLSPEILINVTVFGMTNLDSDIKRYAEDIMLYIIKSRTLVSETVWNKIIQALIPSLPLLICHVKRNSLVGKMVMALLDPDAASENGIPPIVMLKCNIQLLFSKESYFRDEAFSRICWSLASQKNSRELLPKFNVAYDKTLANVCCLKLVSDINKSRFTDHFYQPTSLSQVMEVLDSENLEPVVKRSALNQVSVMMEDPLLHQVFLGMNGVQRVLDVLKSALNERDYRNYPDSVVPIVSILKNVCLYHFNVREELGTEMEIFYFILRGLFLFFTEERTKQDTATLLCLLIFKDFIKGSPSNASFSLPNLVRVNMHLPFSCNGHWSVSNYTRDSLKELIVSDLWCLTSVQIQWNLEMFGGFEELTKMGNVDYEGVQFDFCDDLKLSTVDLKALKTSSLHFCVNEYLNAVQNGTTHGIVLESVEYLTMLINLYKMTNFVNKTTDNENFLSHSWEQTFEKFLKSLPSCKDDMMLLRQVIKLLVSLVPFYNLSKSQCWIVAILKRESLCLLDLLTADGICEENKMIGQELLKLITVCACREQRFFLNFYTADPTNTSKPWTHIIRIIADILKFSDSQHFYNLAYLDFLLLCLVHLTATLGWSDSKLSFDPKETIASLIRSLCELIRAFHCGKGPSAAVSVMGLSITRHVLLILNNLVTELQNSKIKFWERFFFDDRGGNSLKNFLTLWMSRDVIVRAGALQLFGSLVASPGAAVEVISEVNPEEGSILNLAFGVLVDNYEANIVREYAAQLLSNLVAHMAPISSQESPHSNTSYILKKNYAIEVLDFVKEYDLFGNLELILNNLFTSNVSDDPCLSCSSSQESCGNSISTSTLRDSPWENSESISLTTTPGFLKTIGVFLYNIVNLAPEDIANTSQECGLVKLMLRSLCNPSMSVCNSKELSLYCDILEMDTAICEVLSKLVVISSFCLGTVLHTYDCLSALMSLLNYKNFHTHLPQLVYLRNNLWAKIFYLLSALLENADVNVDEFHNKSIEALTILCRTVFESKCEPFLETVCESISCLGSSELQNSALTFLTSLLKTECYRIFGKSDTNTLTTDSLQNVLDSVRMSRSVIICGINHDKDKVNLKKHKKIKDKQIAGSSRYKMNLLEEAYFGQVLPNLEREASDCINDDITFVENSDGTSLAGAELCKILLYFYDVSTLRNRDGFSKNKENVMATLTSLLCISDKAKRYALENGFLSKLVKQLKEKHIQLSLESVDCLRRVSDKKRICPLLNDMNNLVRLLTNFMVRKSSVKSEAAALNLADVVHKLWVWFLIQNTHRIDILRLLKAYSTGCNLACQSMALTNSMAGSGPRKVPTNDSLLHAIVALVIKEMDQVSKMHDLTVLKTCFDVLCNCCESLECRILISKSNLFNGITQLHPGKTKKQKPWPNLEFMWLDFLQAFTAYPEGQVLAAKTTDVWELVMSLTFNARPQNQLRAMLVLRNIAFYQANRSRLLGSGEFLNILQRKLANGTCEERNAVVATIWVLAANNQKGKKILKSIHLDKALNDIVKQHELLKHEVSGLTDVDMNRIIMVLNLLQNNN